MMAAIWKKAIFFYWLTGIFSRMLTTNNMGYAWVFY